MRTEAESPGPVAVYLGLGSNTGDREGQIRAALRSLDAVPGVSVVQVSTLRETEPVGGPPQGPFLNGAAKLETTLSAAALLGVCRELERQAGRDMAAPRNQPRPLDLDILFYGDSYIDSRHLQVPHPRLTERPFVLEPLAELGVDDPASWARPHPLVIHEPQEFAAVTGAWLRGDCVTGLVPTMGALHDGHAALLRTAREECDRVAATIFVNPLQFRPGEDYDSYPRDLDADLEVLAREGVDAVFAPPTDAMYPGGSCTRVSVGVEAQGMEGAARPEHFAGVATVVAKLLALARPTTLYLGRKDAQQVAVVRRMIEDLSFPVHLRECDTVREADGVALSSRNARLTAAERRAAPVLFRALSRARDLFREGERDIEVLRRAAVDLIATEPSVDLDYLEIRREGDLAPLPEGAVLDGRVLVAARIGGTRLLDNLSLGDPLG